MQDNQHTLYGVSHYRAHSFDGSQGSEQYLVRLGLQHFGFMRDRMEILYFHDEAKRDAFCALFGGVKMTLNRKASNVVSSLNEITKGLTRGMAS